MLFESIDPWTQEVIGVTKSDSQVSLEKKVESSQRAFDFWKIQEKKVRSLGIQHLGEILQKNRVALAGLITAEMGKLLVESLAEVDKCISLCKWFVGNGEQYLQIQSIQTDATHSYVRWNPLGPVFGIMPWNFPLWQVFRFMIPNLFVGNTVVLKHAPNVCLIASKIQEFCLEAGMPHGVMTAVFLPNQRVKPLIQDFRIRGLAFTGSEMVGRKVASAAAEALKPQVIELGGNDPFIVFKDADLGSAAKQFVRSRFGNAGQVCIAAKRLFLAKEVELEFIAQLIEEMEKLKFGNPKLKDSSLAPLAKPEFNERLHSQVMALKEKGWKTCFKLQNEVSHPCEYTPEVLVGGESKELQGVELFGPVCTLQVFDCEKEVIKEVNQGHFGLGISLWAEDFERLNKWVNELEFGMVFINGLVKSDPRLPFGGVKNSGYGRELSFEGVRTFMNSQTVWIR